jgi:methylated-DNA-protein-cysteine methyltransferase-like protein
MKQSFFESVYEVVKQIPRGKVATYGQIAKILLRPHSSRQVGYALHANPNPRQIPCHRVVNRFGQVSDSFAFGGKECQKALLINEGIKFNKKGLIDLEKYGCFPFLIDLVFNNLFQNINFRRKIWINMKTIS